jgi:hypothetical protein
MPYHKPLGPPWARSTLRVVTAAHDYDDLHRLVDRLTPGQARALRAVALVLVESRPDETEALAPANVSTDRRRRLSFAGIMDAEPDLAERSEDILRAEFGRRPE